MKNPANLQTEDSSLFPVHDGHDAPTRSFQRSFITVGNLFKINWVKRKSTRFSSRPLLLYVCVNCVGFYGKSKCWLTAVEITCNLQRGMNSNIFLISTFLLFALNNVLGTRLATDRMSAISKTLSDRCKLFFDNTQPKPSSTQKAKNILTCAFRVQNKQLGFFTPIMNLK